MFSGVEGADRAARARDEADDAEVARRVGAHRGQQVAGQQALEAGAQLRRHDLVVGAHARVEHDAEGAASRGRDEAHRRRGQDLAAGGADRVRQAVDEHLVAALDRPHDLAGRAVARAGHPPAARPQVGRGQVVEAAVELRVQQRAPERVPQPRAAASAQPVLQAEALQVVVGALELAAGGEGGQARLVRGAQPREGQQLPGRRHRRQTAVLEEARAGAAEAERVVAQPDLRGQRADAVVRGQDDVVVAVDRDPAERRRPGQAAELRVALVDRHRHAGLDQAQRGGQADQAAADDADARPGHAGRSRRSVSWRAIRRA